MRRPAAPIRRPAAAAAECFFELQRGTWPCDLSVDEVRDKVREAVKSTVPGQVVDMGFSAIDASRDRFYCTSCESCKWRGFTNYDSLSGTYSIRCNDLSRPLFDFIFNPSFTL